MISSEDVRRVTFDKAMRGYRCDDVDDYLKQVAESMDALLTSLMLNPPPRLCLIPSLSRPPRLCRSRNHRPPATITPLKLPPRRSRPLWPSPPRKR